MPEKSKVPVIYDPNVLKRLRPLMVPPGWSSLEEYEAYFRSEVEQDDRQVAPRIRWFMFAAIFVGGIILGYFIGGWFF